MKQGVIKLLGRYRVMTIASLRPDGWPQATMVGYANEGRRLYFIVPRRSQKLANISHDNRVSIAIGQDTRDLFHRRVIDVGAGSGASRRRRGAGPRLSTAARLPSR